MTTFNKIFVGIILNMLCLQSPCLCQQFKVAESKDYVINYSIINFHFCDSIIPFTLFVEPNGRFYLKDSVFKSSTAKTEYIYKIENKKELTQYKQVYKSKTDSIINIQSYFPLLLSKDSAYSVKSEYNFIPLSLYNQLGEDFKPIPLIYELEYSYLLTNFSEPRLYNSNIDRSMRIIFPEDGIANPGRYYSIRIDFHDTINIIYYSVIDFDSSANCFLKEHHSCNITNKKIKRLEDAIAKINFDEERVFSTADDFEKFLIEYKNGSQYYAFRKSIDTSARRNEFKSLYMILYSLAFDCSK